VSSITSQKGNILIVDDEPISIMMLYQYLTRVGFRIFVAQDGQGALSQVALVQPDVILLDVMMPDLDGFEICRRLQANEATQRIPIIFMTGLTRYEDEITGLELGAVGYIKKPIDLQEALAWVRRYI